MGHFLGGMVAAEMSAVSPGYVNKLVLASPAGLWRDDAPVADFLAMNPAELQECLWAASGDDSLDADSGERAKRYCCLNGCRT